MQHHWKRLAISLALLLVATALSVLPGTALAHEATLLSSAPAAGTILNAPPAQVTVKVSEELDTKQSTLRVLDAAGKQVSDGNGRVDLNDPDHQTMIAGLTGTLPAGTYTVAWHAALTDGDATDGTFQFTIAGPAAAQASPTAGALAGTTATAAAGATIPASATPSPIASATAAPSATPSPRPPAANSPASATSTLAPPAALPVTGADGGQFTGPLIAFGAALIAFMVTVAIRRARELRSQGPHARVAGTRPVGPRPRGLRARKSRRLRSRR